MTRIPVALALSLALAASALAEEDLEAEYDRTARRAAPRDRFPVLDSPKMTKAAEAGEDVRDDEPVIGIAIRGEAKAYPLSVMGRHELANDTCGKVPIAVSW